jgi:hypothetical protein
VDGPIVDGVYEIQGRVASEQLELRLAHDNQCSGLIAILPPK